MKIALLITDNREPSRQYGSETPVFGTAPEALLEGFAAIPSLEVHVLSCTQRPMKSPAKLTENMFYHSLHVPKIGWLRTGYYGCIRAVRRKLREIQPDVVHGQGTERDCAISAVFSGFPNVVTIHGNMALLARHLKARPGSFLWCMGLLENITLPRAGGVFCNSAYTESLVRTRNPRTWRVPNALRAPFFNRVPSRPPNRRPRLINIGVISPRKRQLELIALFKRLHDRGERCQIEFVGPVDEESSYGREFLEAIPPPGAQDYALYSGTRETAPLIAALDQADGCIHFPTEEAFGLVVGEALARNLKFFGSHVGGIVDIASSIEGTELLAVDDWGGLEAALLRWMREGCPRPKNAAQAMADMYHPRLIAERHVEIYQEVFQGRRDTNG